MPAKTKPAGSKGKQDTSSPTTESTISLAKSLEEIIQKNVVEDRKEPTPVTKKRKPVTIKILLTSKVKKSTIWKQTVLTLKQTVLIYKL